MTGRSSGTGRAVPFTVVLVLVGVFCAGVCLSTLAGFPSLPGFVGSGASGGHVLARSTPTRLSIPSLGVRANVVEVGQASDGSIAEPPSDPTRTTGWYRPGPTPGERGTAVIVGHVDTKTEPAIFHNLREVRKGTLIEVTRRDGQVATFRVDSVRTAPKTAFPSDQVFGKVDRSRLVLVTCGGRWVGGDLGYADNVIVFATLA
jgi:Sortase domain